jgi:hypothetical protein
MKYLSTFNGFSINENTQKELENTISSKIESLSESEIEVIKNDLENFANKIGISIDDLKDEELVKKALLESGLNLESMEINEGLKDWWKRIKNKFYNFLTKLGMGGMLVGMITSGIGAEMMSSSTNLPNYVVVTPSSTIVIGGVAFAISLIATIVGVGLNSSSRKK